MPKRILFSVVRNEAPFLLEWIAYHRHIGFDRIIIYSNNCTDLTEPLLRALANAGIVEHFIHDPEDRSPQAHAVTLFMAARPFAPGDFILFIDADEYLNIKLGDRRLAALVERIGNYQGIMISWRIFGDSGHQRLKPRLISNSYDRCAGVRHPSCQVVKTFVRAGEGLERVSIHKPQFSSAFWSGGGRLLVGTGTPMDVENPIHRSWINGKPSPLIPPEEVSYDLAQINHYCVRSRAAFEIKYRRGAGGGATKERRAIDVMKYHRDNYKKLNLNDDVDETILFHEAAVDRSMAELHALPEISELSASIREQYLDFEDRFLSNEI